MNNTSKILRHLDEDYTIRLRDPIWKDITLSPALVKIIASRAFQKLHHIKQLGPTYLVYPGATHSRFSHSLGVFHLARLMIARLVKRARPGSYSLPGVKAFLCASLLHDLGHYPYAHSLKDLRVEEHERLTAGEIVGDGELKRLIRRELDVPPGWVASIIDQKAEGAPEMRSFQRILSGVLDPDKLDYLNRDAVSCGVPYGIQDFEFICSQLEPVPERGMGIRRKGLPSVENILFSKYLMYRNVYWHPKVRAATAMIKKAVFLALQEGVIQAEDLYGLDDRQFVDRLLSRSFPPFQLIRDVSEFRLYHCLHQIPFHPENPFHCDLENLETRWETEKRLGACWGVDPRLIIIDVPERISFEMDLPVLDTDEVIPYGASGSVFNAGVVGRFALSLRNVSFLAGDDPGLADALETFDIPAFLQNGWSAV